MQVVLYLRYSSSSQTEQSIEGQDHVCTKYCEQQGYEIVGRYIDRALSASKDTDKRVQFQKMIKDAEKQKFQGIVVYKLDRFARNRYDSATYKARLKKNRVRVISATESISDNPEGVLLESVLEGMAEFYSLELAQKVTRGMHESALKCNVCGGSTPIGYKVENKKYVIDEAGAQIVREAFQLYNEGKPIREICRIFSAKGYRTATGAEFNKNSFTVLLSNERYTGVYIHGDVRIEGGMPAIISKELFGSVQEKVAKNKKAPARSKGKVDYLLTQKLFCGHCGAPMVGESGRSVGGKTYYYYTCTTHKRQHTCPKKAVPKEWLEELVANDAISSLTPDVIQEIAKAAVKYCEDQRAHNTVIPALQAELGNTQRGIDNLIAVIEKGVSSDQLVKRIQDLEDQKRLLRVRIEEAERDVLVIEESHVVWWLSKFINGEFKDENFRRKVIDLLVNSVTVYDEPDGEIRVDYVLNLLSDPAKTIRCSDLDYLGAPPQDNPNYLKFGFLVFPEVSALTIQRKHPRP